MEAVNTHTRQNNKMKHICYSPSALSAIIKHAHSCGAQANFSKI